MRPHATLRLATADDNPGLLDLARACPMQGVVSISLERAPDFFALERLRGDPAEVVVAVGEDGTIAGCASLATREVYVDGEVVRCLHVGDLRVLPEWRRSDLVWRIHAFCWERCFEAGLSLMFFSIMVGNAAARSLLRRGRNKPIYRAAGPATVLGIAPLLSRIPQTAVRAEPARPADLPHIVDLLDRQSRRRNFAPVWTAERLERQLVLSAGLSLDRFLVVKRSGRVLGVAAAWDQRSMQRTMITGMSRRTFPFRLAYDLVALVRRRRRFPSPGEELRLLYLTHLAVDGDDPAVFRALLAGMLRERQARDVHLLDFALSGGHPLLGALGGLAVQRVPTEVWTAAYADSPWSTYDFTRQPVHHEASQVY